LPNATSRAAANAATLTRPEGTTNKPWVCRNGPAEPAGSTRAKNQDGWAPNRTKKIAAGVASTIGPPVVVAHRFEAHGNADTNYTKGT
jgi:hypothetical protein